MDNNADGDMQPLMDSKPMMEAADQDGPKPGEYVEKGTFCYCCSTKVGIIIIAILLIIDFFIEIYNVYMIYDNDFFDPIYGGLYVAILVIYFAAVILLFIYLVANDSPGTRGLVPWGFLLGAIANFLIVIWIIIYIGFLYEEEKVYLKGNDNTGTGDSSTMSADDQKKKKYKSMSKPLYIIDHIIGPLLAGILFLLEYFSTKVWVKNHENQQRAYG